MNRRRNRPYYHTCPVCGANLDPGERCDCNAYVPASIPEQEVTTSLQAAVTHGRFSFVPAQPKSRGFAVSVKGGAI